VKNIKGYYINKWILKNPYIILRTAKGFLRALFNKDTLRSIEIFPSMQCNLKCSMCSVEKFKKKSGIDLTIDDYSRIAREGALLGATSLTILGGEPLLVENLENIIRVFKKNKFYIHMVSNATLADRQRLTLLQKSGLDGICFSLDSVDEEENDRIRGFEGHYQKVHEAIKIGEELGLIVSMAPVFFPGSLENAIRVVKFCQKEGYGASGSQVSPVGAWEDRPVLSKHENDRLRQLLKEFPRLTFDWALSYKLKFRCPAGREKIAITNHGDVCGCSINPISYGNIKNESIKKIMKRMRVFSQIKKESSVCLAGEDLHYIEKYLRPLHHFRYYPVSFNDHPAMTEEEEPGLYSI
jgi:MoaA/NifB/PqqE/SkfB family radical SAM enzyme